MKNKIVHIINTFLKNLEKILAVSLLIMLIGNNINIPWLNSFFDLLATIIILLMLIWLAWCMFFGRREILLLPPKLKQKIKKINFNTGKRRVFYIVPIVLTIMYIIFLILGMNGKILTKEYFLGIQDTAYIIVTIVYVFCMLISISASFSVLPNIDKILVDEFGLKNVVLQFGNINISNHQYCKHSKDGETMYHFSYEITKQRRQPFSQISKKNIEYYNISGEVIIEDYLLPTMKQNFRKVQDEYDFLIITPEIIDNKTIVKIANRLEYTDTVSAKYVVSLIVSMIDVAEQLTMSNIENNNKME